jgi:GTP-binding protein Era
MEEKTLIVAIAGAPNAGKSTLINKIVGQKISIVTSKCQTTRFNIRGVVNADRTQLVFIDTPGIFKPVKNLEKGIVKQARSGLEEADLICLLLDPTNYSVTNLALEQITRINKPKILVINKIDSVKDKTKLLEIAGNLNQHHKFDATFMISAKKGVRISDLKKYLQTNALVSPWLFDQDVASDVTDRLLSEEITREALYHCLGAELPYSVDVQTEAWEEKENGSVKICQVIHVLKSSQKKMIIGAHGQKLKQIGQRSRAQLNSILERTVHLFLYVKTKEDWIEKKIANHMLPIP